MSYRKIPKSHPAYTVVMGNLARGNLMCDAYSHNSERGCPNPKCFNFPRANQNNRNQ